MTPDLPTFDLSKFDRVQLHLEHRLGPPKSQLELLAGLKQLRDARSDIKLDEEGYPILPPFPGNATVWQGRAVRHGLAARIVPPTMLILPVVPPGGWRGVDVVGLYLTRLDGRVSSTETTALAGESLQRAASVMPEAGGHRPYRSGEPLAEGDVLVLDLVNYPWGS